MYINSYFKKGCREKQVVLSSLFDFSISEKPETKWHNMPCLPVVLNERDKSRFVSFSVMNSLLIISQGCRVCLQHFSKQLDVVKLGNNIKEQVYTNLKCIFSFLLARYSLMYF